MLRERIRRSHVNRHLLSIVCATIAAFMIVPSASGAVFLSGFNPTDPDFTLLLEFDARGNYVGKTPWSDNSFVWSITPRGDGLLGAGDGVIKQYSTDAEAGETFVGGISSSLPTRIETDIYGSIYVANGSSFLQRYDPDGNLTGNFSSLSLPHLRGVDADASGNIYVRSHNDLVVINPTGAIEHTISYRPNGNIIDAADLAIDDATDRLFVADEKSPQVAVFDISGDVPIQLPSFETPVDTIGLFVSAENRRLYATAAPNLRMPNLTQAIELDLDTGELIRSYNLQFSQGGLAITDIVAFVPEPSSVVVALLGMLGFVGQRSRRVGNLPR